MKPNDNSPNITSLINQYNFIQSNGINLVHINIQSIRKKIDDLEEYINQTSNLTKSKIHIIALSEIWIYENENKFYNLSGYNVYFSNRNNNRSGGCCYLF